MKVLPESVWQWHGPIDGPGVLVFGGIHGNEVTGVRLVEELRRDVDAGTLSLAAGTLTLAIGNPLAVERNARGSEPYADLNRLFSPSALDGAGTSYETVRARELAPLIAAADVLIDLHATNKPSDPFLACVNDTPRHRELCRFFTCEKMLFIPDSIIPGTTDAYVDAHGGIGICFESGWVGDLSRVGEMRTAVDGMLAYLGLVPGNATLPPDDGRAAYMVTETVVLDDRGFAFATGRGTRSFEPFVPGDLIGTRGTDQVLAPYDGVLVFPKVPELWKVGSPVGFFAKRIS